MRAYCLRFWLILLIAMVAAACGKPDEKSRCEGVVCEGGSCDPETGECVNPAMCGDLTTCVNGYACVQGQCVVEFACNADNTCERGSCFDGACLNPDRCDSDIDCVPGFACDGDQCIEDKCDVVDCDRGVCEKETGACVNAAVCTSSTQQDDCLDGFTCYDQSCADEVTVCADLGCDRGSCSFLDLACINPEDCGGDDLNCLGGYFCNAVNQCQQNVCDDNGVSCPRGVCEAATGACVNNDPCVIGADCVDGFYCVSGACTDSTVACEVCEGNQDCSFDEATTSVVCDESPDGCDTTLDCIGSRECSGGQCGNPVPCVADALEPNDSVASAIDWFAVSSGAVRGSVCPNDSDYFSFDVANDPQFTGTLVAIVSIDEADIGVGALALELLDESGASVASTTSLPSDQYARIEYTIGNINQGTYTLVVSDDSLGAGGVEYELFMDLAETSTVEMCERAAVLGASQTGDTSASTSNSLGSQCANDRSATEEAWTLELTDASYVTITLQSTDFDGLISLRGQCESDRSELRCANNNFGIGAESLGARLNPGSYVVVVQGSSSSESGTYALNVVAEPVVCGSSENTCVSMESASVCNSRGTGFDTIMCDNGCDDAIGACIREVADVCASAIDATNGYTGQLALGLLRNEYDPGSACVPPGFSTVTDGPEGVFSLTLQPNEVVYATATPVDFDDIGIYLVSDCVDVASSCVAGVNDSDFDGDEVFSYLNSGASSQDLFLMVDSESGTLGPVDVEIVVAPSICTPGMMQCNGAVLETCNAPGIGYDTRNCTFGCDMNTSDCIPPANEMCGAGAIDVSAGGTFTGNIDDYANDYDATTSCTNYRSAGADAVYSLVGTVGDIVDVTLDATYDTALYAVSDCSDIAGTCIEGSDRAGTSETIQFVIQDTNPIFIVADAYTSTPSGTFTLTVTVRTPECSNSGQAIMCQADGTTLQYCDDIGFFADYACATTCSAGACDQPTGDRCFDALPLTPGVQVSGDFDDFEPTLDPGLGTCILGTGTQPGPDAIYEIDLVAGSLLTADLTTSSSSAGMYILDDCQDPADACLWAAPRSKKLEFYAAATAKYYLVVDSTYAFSSEAFTLDVDVQPGFVCQPGGATCNDATSTLTVCSLDGTVVENTVLCNNGCENLSACSGPTAVNDTCLTAEILSGSIRFADTWARFNDDLDPGAAAGNVCGLLSYQTDGPDAIYAVSLAAGDVVDVKVDDLGASDSPAVYIVTDCTDPESSCVDSEVLSPIARAAYISTLGETVYVVVDNTGGSNDDPFIVDIDIRPSECAVNLNACQDSMTREYCDQFGILQTEDCFFGCVAGACNPPTNDTCATPSDLGTGGIATVSYQGYNNDYSQSTVSCVGSTANGPDAVFTVTATAGDLITARLSSSSNTMLWITTTCGDASACVAGDNGGSTGGIDEVTFAAATSGTYFIMADSVTSAPSGTFTLEAIVAPPVCTAKQANCDGGAQNVEVCDGIGSGVEVFQCDVAGCSAGGVCATSTGEHPSAAINANALGQFMGTYAGFADDFNMSSSGSCTNFRTPGADIAYFVDLTMGQTLTATLNGSEDTALYIMDSQSDPERTCLVGDDDFGSGETISYTATADMRVWVIVDAFSSNADEPYTLDLSVQ